MAETDFRVGGRYRFAMTGHGGKQQTPFGGEYLEIVPNRKIVFTDAFELPGAEEMVFHVTFDERDGKTLLTVRIVFASLAQKATHVGAGIVEGLNSGLDQPEELAAGLASPCHTYPGAKRWAFRYAFCVFGSTAVAVDRTADHSETDNAPLGPPVQRGP